MVRVRQEGGRRRDGGRDGKGEGETFKAGGPDHGTQEVCVGGGGGVWAQYPRSSPRPLPFSPRRGPSAPPPHSAPALPRSRKAGRPSLAIPVLFRLPTWIGPRAGQASERI